MAMIGKYSVALSYSVLRLYSNEIFPTSIRNTCMGLCSMIGRVGVMIAPAIISFVRPNFYDFLNCKILNPETDENCYFKNLMNLKGMSKYDKLPFLVFGITGMISALTTLILPETLNRNLPDNLDEAQKINRIG